jgi:hypothetical protein
MTRCFEDCNSDVAITGPRRCHYVLTGLWNVPFWKESSRAAQRHRSKVELHTSAPTATKIGGFVVGNPSSFQHGFSMVSAWFQHGFSMVSAWFQHGFSFADVKAKKIEGCLGCHRSCSRCNWCCTLKDAHKDEGCPSLRRTARLRRQL